MIKDGVTEIKQTIDGMSKEEIQDEVITPIDFLNKASYYYA